MNKLLYLAKRLVLGVPVVLFGLSMTFIILYLSPFDPMTAILGRDSDPQTARQLAVALGLRYPDGTPVPLWIQYKNFLVETITFNFGESWVVTRGQSVTQLVWERMPATVWLGFWSVVIALVLGIPIGLYAGLRSNTWGDYTASFGGIVWRAMPNFWLAVMLTGLLSAGGLLSFYRGFLIPTDVIGTPNALGNMLGSYQLVEGISIPVPNLYNWAVAFKWILPAALVLGSSSMGNEVRIGRTAVLESINAPYIDTAKAKGLSTRSIIGKHVARNALIPLLPVIMGEFYLLIGGSLLVELVFGIRGMGNLFLSAIFASDIPIIGALTYVFILILVFFNIAQDIAYTYIDPRITLDGAGE
ncbi:ABC transporter permease [Halosimplex aquaticum]|uniref:ABC transporter permease n=1 Tax=Halosimplex aquaticum TaxID=3026162 RepID=A0ABD5Y4D4_9EURY|nr:ABC transporter permease [Halosimplex aquaticum]